MASCTLNSRFEVKCNLQTYLSINVKLSCVNVFIVWLSNLSLYRDCSAFSFLFNCVGFFLILKYNFFRHNAIRRVMKARRRQ